MSAQKRKQAFVFWSAVRKRFHNKKTPDPQTNSGTRVYSRVATQIACSPADLLNSYKGLTLPTFIGSLESGTFSILHRFTPATDSLQKYSKI